jgi:hypothetical protein
VKLRDLFRRRVDPADPPRVDPPVPAPARAPDWPTMRPIQRVITAPELITAPDRFSDGLVSWHNPSRSGTLGHYVTPEAPAGVSDGLAVAASRNELPPPSPPRWWPPPNVQRHGTTSTRTSTPELATQAEPESVVEPAAPPAVPVYTLTEHALVSAAGVEVSAPKMALPAVQRRSAEPEPSSEPVPDPELPTGESPPETPLPALVTPPAEPPAEATASSAVSWPNHRPEQTTARRLGLGAPLQRVPDFRGSEFSANGIPVQRRVDSTDGAGLAGTPLPMPSGTVGARYAIPEPEASVAEPDMPAADKPDPASQPPIVQRGGETGVEPVEPPELAPLVSDATPMTSATVAPTEPLATEAAGSSPPAVPSAPPAFLQRSVEATTATPATGAAGAPPSTAQPRVDAEGGAPEVVPLVSGFPPMASVATPPPRTPSTDPVGESGVAGSLLSPLPLQRMADNPSVPAPVLGPEELPPTTPTTPNEQGVAEVDPVTPTDVAPLVSAATPMTSVPASPSQPSSSEAGTSPALAVPGPPRQFVQRAAADTAVWPDRAEPGTESGQPLVFHSPQPAAPVEPARVEPSPPVAAAAEPTPTQGPVEAGVEPVEPAAVAPLVSDATSMTSVAVSPTEPSPSGAGTSTAFAMPGPPREFVQRSAADTAVWSDGARPGTESGQPLVFHPPQPAALAKQPAPAEPSAPVAAAAEPPLTQGHVEAGVEPVEPAAVAPLVSDATPMTSVAVPPTGTASPEPGMLFSSSNQTLSPGFVQRSLGPDPGPVESLSVVPSEPDTSNPATELAPLVSDARPMTSVAIPPTETPSPTLETRASVDRVLLPGFVQRAIDPAQQSGPAPGWWPSYTEQSAESPGPTTVEPSPVQRRTEAGADPAPPAEVAPLVFDSAPIPSVVVPATGSTPGPSAEPGTRPGSTGPGPFLRFVQRAVDTVLHRGQRQVWSPSTPSAAATPTPATPALVSLAPPAVPASESRKESSDLAPLLSDAEPMASVQSLAPGSTSATSPMRRTDEGLANPPIQRAADAAPFQAELPLAYVDAPLVGLVGDRSIEPTIPDHGFTDSHPARESGSAQLAVPAQATMAVQRSAGAGAVAAPAGPLDAPAVRRPLLLAGSQDPASQPIQPIQPIQFVQYVPALLPTVVASDPPRQSTEVVQRADADEPAATSAPATTEPAAASTPAATGAAGAATPGQPAGSTSPTEIDKLVHRLYDPIVRRLKAELQLDRERAGRSLDLWH